MPTTIELARGDPELIGAIRRSRQLLGRKALLGAAASAVPIPGLDWVADAALLSRLVPQISAQFNLSVTQIERLSPREQERVHQAVAAAGAMLVGRIMTRELLMTLARHAGIRLSAKQAARFVPVAGQLASAALGYAALRTLGEMHIRDCVKVAAGLRHQLPGPQSDVDLLRASTRASVASRMRSAALRMTSRRRAGR